MLLKSPFLLRPVWTRTGLALHSGSVVLTLLCALAPGQQALRAQEKGTPKTANAVDRVPVPEEAIAFCHVRLRDFWKSKTFSELQREKGIILEAEQSWEKHFGLPPTSLATLTGLVFSPADAKADPAMVLVLTTQKPYDRAAVLKALPQAEEKRHAKKTYYTSPERPEAALHLADPHTLVRATPAAVRRFLEIADTLEMKDRIRGAQGFVSEAHPMIGGLWVPPKFAEELNKAKLVPGMEWLRLTKGLKVAMGTLEFGEKVRAGWRLTYGDKERAKNAVEDVVRGLKKLELGILATSYLLIQAKDKELSALVLQLARIRKAVEGATVELQGAGVEITIELAMRIEDYIDLLNGLAKLALSGKSERK